MPRACGTSRPASTRSPATKLTRAPPGPTMSRTDYRQWEPVFPEWGAAWEDFEELIDDLYFPADAVVGDVSLDGVVSNLFGEESD